MTGTLLVRVDAGPDIGVGHLQRCRALAAAWERRGWRVAYATTESLSLLPADKERHPVSGPRGSDADARETATLAKRLQASWLVLDGYVFEKPYQQMVQGAAAHLLLIDDHGRTGAGPVDLVLDQNVATRRELYHVPAQTRLMLGPRYALLRPEFLQYMDRRPAHPDQVQRVLVSMGGADPTRATEVVLAALETISFPLQVTVIVGPANPRAEELRARASTIGPHKVSVVQNAPDLAQLMANADLAIAGAGVTALELCFMGLPSVLLSIADNQLPVARFLHEHGAARFVERTPPSAADIASAVNTLIDDVEQRRAMTRRGRSLFDGRGADRVVVVALGRLLGLRPAADGDARILWEWANDPETRAASYEPAPIPWEVHVQWFQKVRQNPNVNLFVVADPTGEPLGQARFESQAGRATLSASLAAQKRGQGWAAPVLARACEEAFRRTRVEAIDAYIKESNSRSIRAFSAADFDLVENLVVKGVASVRMTLKRMDVR